MNFEIKTKAEYNYIDEGEGEVLVMLHGLFGALSNWNHVIDGFKNDYRLVIPMMPIYEMPLRKAGLKELLKFVKGFIKELGLTEFSLVGNSLGGHIAQMYVLDEDQSVKIKSMVLTCSSGLFENSLGGSYPKRGNYEYIKEKVEYTFYDPKIATKEYIDEIFDVTNSTRKCLNIIAIAKSAQRHNLASDLPRIKIPVLLIWGLNDTITPPVVAHEFSRLIANARLRFIDKCCHAPMMERPVEFNSHLKDFLDEVLT